MPIYIPDALRKYRYRLSKSVVALFVITITLTSAYSQKTSETNSGMIGNEQILGHLIFPPGERANTGAVIKVKGSSSPEITGVTDPDGSFRITHLRPDQYTVLVDAGDEYEKATELVSIGNPGPVPAQTYSGEYLSPDVYEIRVYLKRKRGAALTESMGAPNPALANLPAAVRDLYGQALESAVAGNNAKAIDQLKSVIAQAPAFAPAYNELAVQYLKIGKGAQAVETLKVGLAIEPDNFSLLLEYGIALVNQKKFEAAETQLRRAIEINKAESPAAAYYLGLALMSQQKIDGAQAAFESVVKNGGDNVALAHRYLGGIYWHNKQYGKAADELDKYLKLEPKATDADKIRGTIKELRQKKT